MTTSGNNIFEKKKAHQKRSAFSKPPYYWPIYCLELKVQHH